MIDASFRPGAAIFDMDGLMLDTEKPALGLWARAGKSMGIEISAEMVISTLGIDDDGMRPIFLNKFGYDFPYDALLEKLEELVFEEFSEGIAHKKGLSTMLDHLSTLCIPMAVATSTNREKAAWKLRQAGVYDRFGIIVCGDEIKNGKPAPDIFLLAAERLGFGPSQCVGFEDSAAGLKALHAAKIRSVFIKDMVEPPDDVLATVWRRYDNLADAVEIFG